MVSIAHDHIKSYITGGAGGGGQRGNLAAHFSDGCFTQVNHGAVKTATFFDRPTFCLYRKVCSLLHIGLQSSPIHEYCML